MVELEAIATMHGEQQRRNLLGDILGWVAFVDGRPFDAVAIWRPVAANQGMAALVPMVAHVDIWLGDADGAEQILRDGTSNLPDANAAGVIRRGLLAGIAGLRGDREAALIGYRELVA